MKYTKSQINAIRYHSKLRGFINLKLSEKDCVEYLDKFNLNPPDTSSEAGSALSAIAVAFDDERDKEEQEFWQKKFCQNKKRPAGGSIILPFILKTNLLKSKNKDFYDFVDKEKYSFPDYACEITIMQITKTYKSYKKLFGLPFLQGQPDFKEEKVFVCTIEPIGEKRFSNNLNRNNSNTVGFFKSLEEFFDWTSPW